ncbi:MAG: ECF transporter S component [Candidatus Bathycorpusculaceae bacterium]
MKKPKISAREVALSAIFAALSWVASKFIPGIPIIGAEGSRISWDASLAPIYGIIIGPYLGFLAALIGGLVAAGSLFTVLTSFCTGLSAFVAGMLTIKGNGNKKSYGWIFSATALALLLVGWYSTEVGRAAPFYPIPHIAGLLIVLFARGWIAGKVSEGKVEETSLKKGFNTKYFALGIILLFAGAVLYFRHPTFIKVIGDTGVLSGILSFLAYALLITGALSIIYGIFSWIKPGFVTAVALACYCGIIADHMLGNLIFLGMIDVVAPALKEASSEAVASLFMTVLPISIVERTLFTAIATTIAVALLPTLRKAGIAYRKTQ